MESIEELRKYCEDRGAWLVLTAYKLNELADAIEAEHKEELRRQHNKGYSKGYGAGYDAGYDVGFANADDWLTDNEAEMAKHGWVKLPVDADGEVIHIGDVMENNERVARIVLTDGSWEPSVYTEESYNVLHEHFCNKISHYHESAVEDVLLEACKAYHALLIEGMSDVAHDMPAPSEIIAEYAAKLRLAGDGREQ